MISTDSKRVQLQDIVEHQLPAYVRDDFPLIVDFLKQYYIGQEYPGAPVDLIQNIDLYLKLETLTSNAESTELSSNVSLGDTTISVSYDVNSGILGTTNFPEKYGLIQINDEVILYTYIFKYKWCCTHSGNKSNQPECVVVCRVSQEN